MLVAVFLLAMLTAIPLIAAVSASATQSSVVASRAPSEGDQRNLGLQVRSSNETEIDSESADHISIHFFTQDGISIKLEYNSESNTSSTEFQLHVKFITLVELVGNTTVSSIDLTKVQYSSPAYTDITSSSGAKGYRIESHSIGTAYEFQIIAYIYNNPVFVNSTNLNPTQMKITIVIKNFPYTQSNSALGLVVDARSQAEIHRAQPATGEDDIEVSTTVSRGYFSWADSALVDNVGSLVTSSVSKQGQGYQITLIYPHGTTIVHDPVLGVSYPSAFGLSASTLLFIGLAAVLTLAVVLVVRRSRPGIRNTA